MFSTISQDYENRQVIFIVTSLFLLIGIVRLRQVGGHPRVSVRLLPAEVLTEQIMNVLQGHFLRFILFKGPLASLSTPSPS